VGESGLGRADGRSVFLRVYHKNKRRMDQELVNSAIEIEQRAADAKSASVIQKLRLAYIALAKKVQDLEMRLANDKKEMYEDPIVCHAMHLNS
jgi:hypothetical protein